MLNDFFLFAGGPYAAFGGRDASRGLATFQVTASDKEGYDDLSDLNTMEMDSVKEWAMQFKGTSICSFNQLTVCFSNNYDRRNNS